MRCRAVVVGAGLVAALTLSACGSSSPVSTASTSSSTTTTNPGTVVTLAPGAAHPVAAEVPGVAIAPLNDSGEMVAITSTGFLPHRLYCDISLPVRWVNESGVAQRIIFDDGSLVSPEIAPWASFVWQPKYEIGIGYHSDRGQTGVLTVQSAANP